MGIFSKEMPTDVCGCTLYQSEKCFSAHFCSEAGKRLKSDGIFDLVVRRTGGVNS